MLVCIERWELGRRRAAVISSAAIGFPTVMHNFAAVEDMHAR